MFYIKERAAFAIYLNVYVYKIECEISTDSTQQKAKCT